MHLYLNEKKSGLQEYYSQQFQSYNMSILIISITPIYYRPCPTSRQIVALNIVPPVLSHLHTHSNRLVRLSLWPCVCVSD